MLPGPGEVGAEVWKVCRGFSKVHLFAYITSVSDRFVNFGIINTMIGVWEMCKSGRKWEVRYEGYLRRGEGPGKKSSNWGGARKLPRSLIRKTFLPCL